MPLMPADTTGTLTAGRVPPGTLTGRPTPVRDVALRAGSRWCRVGLKLESCNPSGSIKYRTSVGLLSSLEQYGQLEPGTRIIESTSGNLGVALALLCRARGYRFTAVTDPKTDPAVLERIVWLGAQVMRITEPDTAGGYLLSRLSAVRRLLAEDPGAVWPNQYENPANPSAHYHQTAPEIWRQRPDMDAVFVAASTGGTLAGVGRYLRRCAPSVRVVGVDLRGSRVFGLPGGTRLVTGIGSSRPSTFLRPTDYDDVVLVGDREAIAVCHQLRDELGLGLGGSSGAAIAACARYLVDHPEISRPVCICPDGQANYLNTLYSSEWLGAHDLDPSLDGAAAAVTGVRDISDN